MNLLRKWGGLSVLCGILFLAPTAARAASFFYWDANGPTPGAGGPTPTGTWGTDAYFTTDSSGSGSTVAWDNTSHLAFAAGNDATGAYTVNVIGTQSVSDIHFDEGTVTLQSVSGGTLQLQSAFTGGSRLISAAPGITAVINVPISSDLGVTNFTKYKAGTVVLGAANTYTATTRIEGGTLRLGVSNVMPDSSGLVFAVAQQDGITGTPAIFDTAGFSDTIGTLTLQTNGIIDFGNGTSALSFADSSAINWSGFELIITNFTLAVDSLRFGNNSGGLTPAQLNALRFADYGNAPGQIDLNGFVTPVPEPTVIALAVLGAVTMGNQVRRKRQ